MAFEIDPNADIRGINWLALDNHVHAFGNFELDWSKINYDDYPKKLEGKRQSIKLVVLKTYVLWAWMEQRLVSTRRRTHKDEYPLYEELHIFRQVAECPLCTKFFSSIGCGKCPLALAGYNCFKAKSPFAAWKDFVKLERMENKPTVDDAIRAAGEIARVCWNAYKDIGG